MKFEAFKSESGRFRWRLRDESGKIVSLNVGKVMIPPTSAKQNRQARAAVNDTLSKLAAASAREKA